jgi:hypothetical protein
MSNLRSPSVRAIAGPRTDAARHHGTGRVNRLPRSLFVTLVLIAVVGTSMPAAGSAQNVELEGDYLWRTLMMRAAPGGLLPLIDMVKERLPVYAEFSDAGPFWMRHTQGDQWDLLILFPMRSFDDYFSESSTAAREEAYERSGTSEEEFLEAASRHIAWQEELFVWGPSAEAVAARFEGMGFYHIEIFIALAGQREKLLEQRRMENDYLQRTGRQQNLIFRRAAGAAWDSYTLGFYRDLQQYAQSSDVPTDVQDEAAKAAGFDSSATIGSYMRTLIQMHRDTLAVAIQ